MADTALNRLSRMELLELMYAQAKRIEALQQEVRQLEEELAQRQLNITQAGSLAEATLQLNGVFDAAQASVEQYLQSVEQLAHRQDSAPQQLVQQAELQAQMILDDARKQCRQRERECEEKVRSYWAQLEENLYHLLEKHPEWRNAVPETESQDLFGPDD